MATVTKETKTQKKAKETPHDPWAANRIEIPAVNMDIFKCTLVGTTPLIIHALGPKKRKEMLASMQKNKQKSTAVRPPKDPITEYFDSMYILDGDPRKDQENTFEGIFTPVHYSNVTAIHGVRAAGFRKAMVRAAKSCGAKMTDTRCNMSVYSAFGSFVPIKFETLVSGEDPVKLVGNKSDLRYRPYYHNWSVDFQLQHMSDIIAPEQIIQLLRIAGRVVGVGEWRNERDGENGAFDVDLDTVCIEKQSL